MKFWQSKWYITLWKILKFCIGKFHLSPPVRITELVTEFLHDVEFVVEEYFRPLNFYAQLNLPAERLQLLVRIAMRMTHKLWFMTYS